jgi:hypothetical protein
MILPIQMFLCCFGSFTLAWVAFRYLAEWSNNAESALASLVLSFVYFVFAIVGCVGAPLFGIATAIALANAIYS